MFEGSAVAEELKQWKGINREFREHGLTGVEVKPISAVVGNAFAARECVVLTVGSSQQLRLSVNSLLRESDKHQDLIQELIATNKTLREEIREQTAIIESRTASRVKDKPSRVDKPPVTVVQQQQADSSLAEQCQQLQAACQKYERDINKLNAKLKKLGEELVDRVLDVISQPGVQHLMSPERLCHSAGGGDHVHQGHHTWCDKKWHHVVPTLELWAAQLSALPELEKAVVALQTSLEPWAEPLSSSSGHRPVDVRTLTSTLNALRKSGSSHSDKKALYRDFSVKLASDEATVGELQGIVEHAMTLFNIRRVRGCYPRFSEMYTSVEEANNVMRALRSLLGLDQSATSTAVVDAVARLQQLGDTRTLDDLAKLTQSTELDSLIEKVRVQEQFFPFFELTMQRLMEILDVNKMDQVLPAVRALKLISGQ